MVEPTYEELKEELRRERVTNELSNKSIIKLLSEKKEQQVRYEGKIAELVEELRDSEEKVVELQEECLEQEMQAKSLEEQLAFAKARIEELAQGGETEFSPKVRNTRGAGRKKAATPETIDMVLKLRETGVSYVKISQVLKERMGVELGRTTVGEIVRGTYQLNPSTINPAAINLSNLKKLSS